MEELKKYNEQLKIMIKQNTFTQRDLAKAVGITENHLSCMLSGKYIITDSMKQRLQYHYEELSK